MRPARTVVGAALAALVLAGCGAASKTAAGPSAPGATQARQSTAGEAARTTTAVKSRKAASRRTTASAGHVARPKASSAQTSTPRTTGAARRTRTAAALHLTTNRARIALPALGADAVTTNSLSIPRGLSNVFAQLALVSSAGKDSRPVRAGQPLVFTDRSGKRLFSLLLAVSYDSATGQLGVRVRLENLNVPDAQAKHTTVAADVAVGYRA